MGNYWAAKGWEITLLTFTSTLDAPFYALDNRIQLVSLNIAQPSRTTLEGIRRNVSRLACLRYAIRQSRPDAIISFLDKTNVLTLLATRGLRIPVIVSERTNPALHTIGYPWSWMRRLLYPRASALVVQTEAVKINYSAKVRKRTWVVPNPVFIPKPHKRFSELPTSKPFLVGLGRLSPEKGFDLLIRAFAQLPPTCDKWSLVIVGEGPQKAELDALCNCLGLTRRVIFTGLMKKPEEVLRQAGFFVLPSRYEGFPNALIEAMACGLPVISFDCPNGPREIIRDGVDGMLVSPGDSGALCNAMGRLIINKSLREKLALNAMEAARRFDLDRIMGVWENLLDEVLR